MTRALVSIGCNTYRHISRQLTSAEFDAERMFNELIGSGPYHYRSDLSALLKSPNVSQLREVIQGLYETKPAVVTIYFAGHAESKDGRLYLKLIETRNDMLTMTSLSLADLLDWVVQCPSVEQANLVIDACNAGGLSADLSKVLADQAQRLTGDMSISILAASGPENAAIETGVGGRLTSGVIDVLKGQLVGQRWSPFLELAQIAEAVLRLPKVAAQRPSHWSMNLRGANVFAPNPAFDPATAVAATLAGYFQGNVSLTPAQEEAILGFVRRIQEDGYSPEALRPVQQALRTLPENHQVSVFLGLADGLDFYDKRVLRIPPYREIMLMQALLPLTGSPSVQAILSIHCDNLYRNVEEKLARLAKDMESDLRALIDRPAGMSEIYYLPLRLSILLGWIGATLLHAPLDELKLRELIGTILRIYGNSIVALDERQSPGFFLFLAACRSKGWSAEFEEVLGRLLNDVLATGGRVNRGDSDAKRRLKLLVKRYDLGADLSEVVQSPSELIAVVLSFGAIGGLDEIWDSLLFELDHTSINMFYSSDPRQFGDDRIDDGTNLTMTVGREVHTLGELRQVIRDLQVPVSYIDGTNYAALDALSLAIPDRVNWPHLARLVAVGDLGVFRPSLRISVEAPDSGVQTVLYDDPGAP